MSGKLDLQKIADELEFDLEDVKMLIEVFIESVEESLTNLKEAITQDDFEMIYQSAHAIKGSAANLTLMDISELAKAIELEAKSKNKIDYQSSYNKLVEQIEYIK